MSHTPHTALTAAALLISRFAKGVRWFDKQEKQSDDIAALKKKHEADVKALENELTEEMRREKLLYQIACKAAIKGGRQYDEAHISWLVEEVLSLPDVTVCPHGRPIAFHLTKKELDRQFNRIK